MGYQWHNNGKNWLLLQFYAAKQFRGFKVEHSMLAHVVIILPDDENHVCYIILSARLCKSDHKTVCTCTLKKNKAKMCHVSTIHFFSYLRKHIKRESWGGYKILIKIGKNDGHSLWLHVWRKRRPGGGGTLTCKIYTDSWLLQVTANNRSTWDFLIEMLSS